MDITSDSAIFAYDVEVLPTGSTEKETNLSVKDLITSNLHTQQRESDNYSTSTAKQHGQSTFTSKFDSAVQHKTVQKE